ncbi:MAG: hypothetical protein ABUK01_01875 [Leptospirales bacterium]
MKKSVIILFVLSLGFFGYCGGGAYIIKEESEGVKLSRVVTDQLMFSSTEIQLKMGKRRMVYKKWFFIKADEQAVHFRYEERYDTNKETADLSELKAYPIKDNTIELPGYKVYIYELKEEYIAYTMKVQL